MGRLMGTVGRQNRRFYRIKYNHKHDFEISITDLKCSREKVNAEQIWYGLGSTHEHEKRK